MTVSEIAALAARGSEIGVRRSVGRLVEQGTVRATEVGRSRVDELNREHIAAPIAVALAGLRLKLWHNFRDVLARWKVRPIYACAFGSAARGDGGPDSDIDVLLVHPPFPGEKRRGRSTTLRHMVGNVALDMTLPLTTNTDAAKWNGQLDNLHELVRNWTGNSLQILDISAYDWADRDNPSAILFDEIETDAVVLLQQSTLATIASHSAKAK